MNLELVIVVFEDENKASAVLKTIEQLESQWDIVLSNAATLVHSAYGEVTVKETHDWDPKHGALFGILVGGLVGAAMGPAGALIGAATVGAASAVVGTMVDLGFPNTYLARVHDILPPGHSALVILVRTKSLNRLLAELSQQDCQLAHWTLEGDFEPALEATLNDVKEEFDSLWYKRAATRAAVNEKLEAEQVTLEQQIASAKVELTEAKGIARKELESRLAALLVDLASLLTRLQALSEDELRSLRLGLRTLGAEAVLSSLDGGASSPKEIEFMETQQHAVLQKLEANLKAQSKVADTQLEWLRKVGAPESMWARTHWDRQIFGLENESASVLEQRRLNLEEQREALDRTMKRHSAKAAGLGGELLRDHEIEFKAMGDRRGGLLRELGLISVEGATL